MKHLLLIFLLLATLRPQAQTKTTFDQYQLALQYSKANDSIKASEAFMQVNPYYLFYLKRTPANLDTFYKRFALTEKAKADYKALFTKAWESRSKFHDTLADLHNRYKACRSGIDTTKSPRMEDSFVARIYKIDSAFSKILYRHVTTKGWPSIEDGALYAWQMVLRDFRHNDYYHNAFVRTGTMGSDQLTEQDRKELKNAREELRWLAKQDSVLKGRHLVFDVTSLIDVVEPPNKEAIMAAIAAARPIKGAILIAEVPRASWADPKMEDKASSEWSRIYKPAERMYESFERSLQQACGWGSGAENTLKADLRADWVIWLAPNISTIRKTPKMTLYVFPGR